MCDAMSKDRQKYLDKRRKWGYLALDNCSIKTICKEQSAKITDVLIYRRVSKGKCKMSFSTFGDLVVYMTNKPSLHRQITSPPSTSQNGCSRSVTKSQEFVCLKGCGEWRADLWNGPPVGQPAVDLRSELGEDVTRGEGTPCPWLKQNRRQTPTQETHP